MKNKKILASCIGNCAHVAGPINFLRLANKLDYQTIFLGPSKSSEEIIKAIKKEKPDIVALSYRLTPEIGLNELLNFKKLIKKHSLSDIDFILGGLPELVSQAKNKNLFDAYFKGGETQEVISYLKNETSDSHSLMAPQNIIDRINYNKPFPLLRHHFGLPSLEESIEGVKKISESKALDIISLGVDQDAQSHFFHPERMKNEKGAGGVPVRTEDDFKKLYAASRSGNFPLMRTYAGTDDLIDYAQMILKTVNNSWSAIPIFWFNQMDGRGPMSLEESLKVHLDTIKWHAHKNIPVEILESHHWSMRDAPDEIAIASGYLGAHISKSLGVKDYISQYMFNTPAHTTQRDDLAKMLAQKELIESLVDDDFNVYTQTRTGLVSYPVNLDKAKGQLASSTMLQMQLNPDIIHVVSYSEANHAATPENVIESANIVKRVVENSIEGMPSMIYDPYIIKKKEYLKSKALEVINKIESYGNLTNPLILKKIVDDEIFWAPQLKMYGGSVKKKQVMDLSQ